MVPTSEDPPLIDPLPERASVSLKTPVLVAALDGGDPIVPYSKKTVSSESYDELVSYCLVTFTFNGLGLILNAVDVTL